MKYSVEVETDSRVYQSPVGSGCGTPANGRSGTPSRHLNWAIEVDILTGEPMQVSREKNNMERVTAEKVSKRMAARVVNEPGAVKKVSRMEREEELIQKAMRKKSRKVRYIKAFSILQTSIQPYWGIKFWIIWVP